MTDALLRCTCTAYNTGSLIDKWHVRVYPVILRAVKRQYVPDPEKLARVVKAIVLLDKGEMGDVNGAHHLKTCPCHPRNRATVPLASY